MPRPNNWKRARQPEQKQQRRQHILAAAARLFEDLGFDRVSLNAIARESGLAKSNLYRYFEGKEDIFLTLVAADYADYYTAIAEPLADLARCGTDVSVSAILVNAAVERPRLCALTTVLSSVLEQHISERCFVDFKSQVGAIAAEIAQLLEAALPGLSSADAHHVQRYLQALVAGLWPMAKSAGMFPEVMARPQFRHVRVDFARDLGGAMAALIRGLTGIARPSPAARVD